MNDKAIGVQMPVNATAEERNKFDKRLGMLQDIPPVN
jgi:hypothetical protein